MRKSNLKITGVVLLVGAVIAAVLLQFFDSGLVLIEHVNRHIQSSDPRVTFTVTETKTYYMLRIFTLLAVALVGVLCLLVSRRRERPVAS